MTRKPVISSVKLKPARIYNTRTGEAIRLPEFYGRVQKLVGYVQTQAQSILKEDFEGLVTLFEEGKRIAPAEYARQQGVNVPVKEMPKEILGKSRVNKLIGHAVVSAVTSYTKSSNEKKRQPRIGPTANLGAVDKQLATLSVVGDVVTLVFKCWDTEYLVEFNVPEFFMKKDIQKWFLPLILKHKDSFLFQFSVEIIPEEKARGKQTAGVDLGRVLPFTAAVINPNGGVVARYTPSGRVRMLNQKRERLLAEKKHLTTKITAYKKMRLDASLLIQEARYKTWKITAIGRTLANDSAADLAMKLAKHSLNTVNVEDLSWVQGKKYGSRWNHSAQQATLTHTLAQKGIRVKKVNAMNTSKRCHSCGSLLTYSSKNRSVYCGECSSRLDRDFNAALNIAKDMNNNNRCPAVKRTSGDNCSPDRTGFIQVIGTSVPGSAFPALSGIVSIPT